MNKLFFITSLSVSFCNTRHQL